MIKEGTETYPSKRAMKTHEAKESKSTEKKEDLMDKMRTATPKMLTFGRRKK